MQRGKVIDLVVLIVLFIMPGLMYLAVGPVTALLIAYAVLVGFVLTEIGRIVNDR